MKSSCVSSQRPRRLANPSQSTSRRHASSRVKHRQPLSSHPSTTRQYSPSHHSSHRMAHSTTSTSDQSMSSADSLKLYTKDSPILPNFDYVVVGGGSGGISSARRAASYGAKVAVIEQTVLGGTCVNVGCIPKKLMWYGANIGHALHDAEDYGFDQLNLAQSQYNWPELKDKRDAYLTRLNGMYYRNLLRDNIYIIRGRANFAQNPDGTPDLSKLVVQSTEGKQRWDDSNVHIQGFDINEFKGKEVLVNANTEITININPNAQAASYQGADPALLAAANTDPLVTNANFVLTAPGGYPTPLHLVEGADLAIDSNGFFDLKKQPRHALVTGAGYIAVELAQVLALVGTKTSLVYRGEKVLRNFDETVSDVLMVELNKQCNMLGGRVLSRIVKLSAEEIEQQKSASAPREFNREEVTALFSAKHPITDNASVSDAVYAVWAQPSNTQINDVANQDQEFLGYFDVILNATGRTPGSHIMNVPTTLTDKKGHIRVSPIGSIEDPSAPNLFAVGDVIGKADLTPVAINVGRRLSDWLFGNKGSHPLLFRAAGEKLGAAIPTVVFSHPPIGTVGLTPKEAEEAYGKDNYRVWNAKFTPMYSSLLAQEKKFQAVTKLITTKEFSPLTQQEEDICIGIHILSPGADEMIQGFGVAVANRLPKSFLDNTIAVHPSSAEELVLFR